MSDNLRSDIILSVNRALLGEIFPELVAVSCKVESESKFELTFFVDSVIPSSRVEDISCIETEILADFPENFIISYKIVISERTSPPALGAFWIFLRKSG